MFQGRVDAGAAALEAEFPPHLGHQVFVCAKEGVGKDPVGERRKLAEGIVRDGVAGRDVWPRAPSWGAGLGTWGGGLLRLIETSSFVVAANSLFPCLEPLDQPQRSGS